MGLVSGIVAPGFEPIAEAFAETLIVQPGVGSAVSVAVGDNTVVDIFSGERATGLAWERSTQAMVWSVSKGVAAMAIMNLADRGVINIDRPISYTWPEFGTNGKRDITLTEVLTHASGLPWWEGFEDTVHFGSPKLWGDVDRITTSIASSAPMPQFKKRMAYHAFTFGWILGEVVRRATGMTLGRIVRDRISDPLGLKMGFGGERINSQTAPALLSPAIADMRDVDSDFANAASATRQALMMKVEGTFTDMLATVNTREFLQAETPGAALISSAGDLAKAYAAVAGIEAMPILASLPTRDAFIADHFAGPDQVTGSNRRMAVGFARNAYPSMIFGPGERIFGHPGLGGSLAFGDPDHRLGFAYVTNGLIPSNAIDGRARHVVDAVYRCAACLAS
ncbi:MAG: class A beta-lactamase-related serine hydrolase [Mesorhizobium sp.]|uniref:serine hydrolase domain-containing protein n=1 Tax=Mesorhizobium sp. TaxID=1871066 RepID=UPI000FE8AAC1|nr:serine hydrolase domain-containing protein [Mesorhizobium sp.]RWL17936.1 MAG: class A beta-lactamase-related serine hydrolase [Mesorhizobium sp.]